MTKAEILSLFSGTSNRISFVNGAIDISSSYTGQNTITTVGTIGTGVWNGSSIASGYGGTGFNSYAKGDLIYASAVNTLAKLAAGTDGQVLTLASGVPTWADAAGGLPSQTGNSGKFLTTDGTSASWATVSASVNTASNYTWTGIHTFNNSVTASSGVAKAVIMTPSLSAAANNDILVGLYVDPVMTPGSFTGVTQYAVKFNGSIYANGQLTGYNNVAVWLENASSIRGTAASNGTIYIDASKDATTGTIYLRGNVNISGSTSFSSVAVTGTGPSFGLPDGGSIRNTATSSNGTMYIDASNAAISGTIHMRTSIVNIGTITSVSSAMLQLVSTTKGFLPPKMTTTQKNAISSPAAGLVVYDTTLNKLCLYTGSVWETVTSS